MKWTLKDVSWLSVVLAIFIILMSLRTIMSLFPELVLQQKEFDVRKFEFD